MIGVLIYITLIIVSLCILYVLSGYICKYLPRNRKFINSSKEVEIYIYSDGLHTDFIVPAITDVFDWKQLINDDPYQTKFTYNSYLGIGWGDRGFYLDIPTWADLTPKVAMKAMLLPSKTVIHVTSFRTIPKDKKYLEKINLDVQSYLKLCAYIQKSFLYSSDKVMHIPGTSYNNNDAFYEASGTYHGLKTCNQWVNQGLIKIGVRMPLWCHGGATLFYQLKKANKKVQMAS